MEFIFYNLNLNSCCEYLIQKQSHVDEELLIEEVYFEHVKDIRVVTYIFYAQVSTQIELD